MSWNTKNNREFGINFWRSNSPLCMVHRVVNKQDLIETHDFSGLITSSNDLGSSRVITISAEVEISAGQNGIIFEVGARGYGIILYLFEGKIYFQGGIGNNFGQAYPQRFECFLPVPEYNQMISVIASASCLLGEACLYVNLARNNQLFDCDQLTGSNPGGIAKVHDSVAANRGGWTLDGEGIFEGLINSCKIYQNQFLDLYT